MSSSEHGNVTTAKIDPDSTYTTAEMARLVFGHKREWFYKNRRRLEQYDDFPGPIARVGNPRYSGAALIEWVHRGKGDHAERARSIVSGADDTAKILAERRDKGRRGPGRQA